MRKQDSNVFNYIWILFSSHFRLFVAELLDSFLPYSLTSAKKILSKTYSIKVSPAMFLSTYHIIKKLAFFVYFMIGYGRDHRTTRCFCCAQHDTMRGMSWKRKATTRCFATLSMTKRPPCATKVDILMFSFVLLFFCLKIKKTTPHGIIMING